ncbi:hypothetical protein C8R44DRAFT_731804 [Mycena epipterygia]|nr:hypothetical protein C8R44DRAFT_731804 [Mycena epipterygia]
MPFQIPDDDARALYAALPALLQSAPATDSAGTALTQLYLPLQEEGRRLDWPSAAPATGNHASIRVQDRDLNPGTSSLPGDSLPETLLPPAQIFSLRDVGNSSPRARDKVNDPNNTSSSAMRPRFPTYSVPSSPSRSSLSSQSPCPEISFPRGAELLPAFMLQWPSPTPPASPAPLTFTFRSPRGGSNPPQVSSTASGFPEHQMPTTPSRSPHPPSTPSPFPFGAGTPSRSSSPLPAPPCPALLSPLRLPTRASTLSRSPSPPSSPTSTLVGSPVKALACTDLVQTDIQTDEVPLSSVLGKRSASQAGLKEGTVQAPPRWSDRITAAVAEGEGGGQASDDDDDYADAPRRGQGPQPPGIRPPCPRGGNAPRARRLTRKRIAATVTAMREELERELEGDDEDVDMEDGDVQCVKKGKNKGNAAGGKTKGKSAKGGKGGRTKTKDGVKKSEVVWNINGEPPVATREAALRIVQFGMLAISPSLQSTLTSLLFELQPPTLSASTASTASIVSTASTSSFAAAMSRCAQLESRSILTDFELMMSYIQAALYIQWRQKVPKGTRVPCYRVLAQEVNYPGVTENSIQHWYSAGTRLIYLAAATSMYIIPMIAVCGLKRKICKEDNVEVIEQLAYLLCALHERDHRDTLSRDCAAVTRTLVVPEMVYIQQVSTQIPTAFSLDFPPDSSGVSETIQFGEIDKMASRLRSFKWNYFKLPPCDKCWRALENPLLAPTLPLRFDNLKLTEDCVAEEVTIRTGLDLKSTPCPVGPENSYTWTNEQRSKAAAALVVKNLDDLSEKLARLHVDGKKVDDEYVCIPPEICEGKVLTLRGLDNNLLAMVITNLLDTLPHLEETSIPIVSAIMTGDVYPVNSNQPAFKYCSTHKVWYNRYSEQGHGAPGGVHPNICCKESVSRVNHSQRAPHPSEEMKEDPEETELLAEFIQLIIVVIELHIKKLLPDEHGAISVFVSRLPLNERSLAHPFGGFVVNVRVSTRGHRDGGDKLFCVVIPFGTFTGGALALFEPGFVFPLRAWDAIIFPSCNVTHFNLDFEGTRLSLVLHSDKYGDRWVQDENGWGSREAPAEVTHDNREADRHVCFTIAGPYWTWNSDLKARRQDIVYTDLDLNENLTLSCTGNFRVLTGSWPNKGLPAQSLRQMAMEESDPLGDILELQETETEFDLDVNLEPTRSEQMLQYYGVDETDNGGTGMDVDSDLPSEDHAYDQHNRDDEYAQDGASFEPTPYYNLTQLDVDEDMADDNYYESGDANSQGSPSNPREVVRSKIKEILVPKVPAKTGMDDGIDPIWEGKRVAFTRGMTKLISIDADDCHYMEQGIFQPDPDLGVGLLRIPVGESKPSRIISRTTMLLVMSERWKWN